MSVQFVGTINPANALVGKLGLLLTILALIGTVARVERRLVFVEADALLIMLVYLGGMFFLYSGASAGLEGRWPCQMTGKRRLSPGPWANACTWQEC
jgi:hypothetical protein